MRRYEVLEDLVRAKRYGGNPISKEESVSDHTWCMMTLAMEYIPIINKKFGTDFYLPDVIYGIAIHDIDEAFTGDIPRPFKHRDAEIEQAIAKTVDAILRENLNEDLYKDLKKIEDRTTPMGYLVKLFDLAQAGYKMKSEIKFGTEFYKTEIGNVTEVLFSKRQYLEQSLGTGAEDFAFPVMKAFIWLCDQFLLDLNNI
jgi:5'-deoxynucleotidase YfbR-like HD superfamily hydrolase